MRHPLSLHLRTSRTPARTAHTALSPNHDGVTGSLKHCLHFSQTLFHLKMGMCPPMVLGTVDQRTISVWVATPPEYTFYLTSLTMCQPRTRATQRSNKSPKYLQQATPARQTTHSRNLLSARYQSPTRNDSDSTALRFKPLPSCGLDSDPVAGLTWIPLRA
jgi:hypothetical protein